MKKTGKQIEGKGLNAVNGGNMYSVKSSNGAVEYYDADGKRAASFVNPFTGQQGWVFFTLGRNPSGEVEATEEQMDELRKNGEVTIDGHVYKKGD